MIDRQRVQNRKLSTYTGHGYQKIAKCRSSRSGAFFSQRRYTCYWCIIFSYINRFWLTFFIYFVNSRTMFFSGRNISFGGHTGPGADVSFYTIHTILFVHEKCFVRLFIRRNRAWNYEISSPYSLNITEIRQRILPPNFFVWWWRLIVIAQKFISRKICTLRSHWKLFLRIKYYSAPFEGLRFPKKNWEWNNFKNLVFEFLVGGVRTSTNVQS